MSSALDAINDHRAVPDRINQWMLAAERQYQRALAAPDEAADEAEIDLFVLAVAQVRRACNMGCRHAQREIRAALKEFDDAAGPVTRLRDLVTHFDVYDRGKGNLQKEQALPSVLSTAWEHDGDHFVLRVDKYVFDSAIVWPACRRLVERCLAALANERS